MASLIRQRLFMCFAMVAALAALRLRRREDPPRRKPESLRCLALQQQQHGEATYDYSGVFRPQPLAIRRVAVFMQGGWQSQQEWGEMVQCVRHTAAAAGQAGVDVHVFASMFDAQLSEAALSGLQASLATLPKSGVSKTCSLVTENRGEDMGQFLQQLEALTAVDPMALTEGYELLLKIHSKTDSIWRERGHESLCGTPAQVHSILGIFEQNPKIGMVAPLGTVFGPDTPVSHIFGHITERYKWVTTAAPAFDDRTQAELRRWRHLTSQTGSVPLRREDMQIAAGSCFWGRPKDLRLMALLQQLPTLDQGLAKGYTSNGGMEHILERLFATNIKADGRLIATMPPAPKPIALYFPQFHEVPENDRYWGKGFTEWTLLRPSTLPDVQKPLPWEEGGLGYYDLTNRTVRMRQGELARAAGIEAFCFYHYWFSGRGAPPDHKVMYKVIEAELEDGEPSTQAFLLSWANEPWSRRWTGGSGEVLMDQTYEDEEGWKQHFEYLLHFFRHPRYLRVEGKPVLVLYRIGHMGTKLVPMCNLWRQLAQRAGLPGVYLIDTVGNFYHTDANTKSGALAARIDGSFHFWPTLLANNFTFRHSEQSSTGDLPLSTPRQYWGAYTGFDRRIRDPADAAPARHSPMQFAEALRLSFTSMTRSPSWNMNSNLFFIAAFNEWNEQALLEPSMQHRFGYLQALHQAVHCMPGAIPWSLEVVFGACNGLGKQSEANSSRDVVGHTTRQASGTAMWWWNGLHSVWATMASMR